MTQTDLAEKSGMSIAAIQKTEYAEVCRLRWDNFRAIAAALGKTEEELEKLRLEDAGDTTVPLPIALVLRARDAAAHNGETLYEFLSRSIGQALDAEERVEPPVRGKIIPERGAARRKRRRRENHSA